MLMHHKNIRQPWYKVAIDFMPSVYSADELFDTRKEGTSYVKFLCIIIGCKSHAQFSRYIEEPTLSNIIP